MKMLNQFKIALAKKTDGITSIVVVIAVSVILTIIIGGIAALTVREIRQASNTELSNRALQTAEAGINAAVQKLNADPTFEKPTVTATQDPANPAKDCDKDASLQDNIISDINQQITCITVKSNFNGSYEGYLQKDKATKFFLGDAYPGVGSNIGNRSTTPNYIKVSWHDLSIDKPNANFGYPSASSLYPIVNGYNYAAGMELNFVYWPKGGGDSKVAAIFIMPGRTDTGYSASGGRTALASVCSGTSGYACTTNNASGQNGFSVSAVTGIDPNAYNIALVVKPRYANTHFKLESYKDATTPTNIFSSKAQIDVTAKVNNLYRRVKADKDIIANSVENVFDSVLFSGDNVYDNDPNNSNKDPLICKRNRVINNGGVYTNSLIQSSC